MFNLAESKQKMIKQVSAVLVALIVVCIWCFDLYVATTVTCEGKSFAVLVVSTAFNMIPTLLTLTICVMIAARREMDRVLPF